MGEEGSEFLLGDQKFTVTVLSSRYKCALHLHLRMHDPIGKVLIPVSYAHASTLPNRVPYFWRKRVYASWVGIHVRPITSSISVQRFPWTGIQVSTKLTSYSVVEEK